MPLVTVVTPCFNSEKYLRETIGSVRAQSFTDWELVLVDDGSTDATPTILAEEAAHDRRIRVVAQPNGGVARARNTGLAARDPGSSFVCFLDSDDLWLPDTLHVLVAALERSPRAVAAFGSTITIDDDGRRLDEPGGHRVWRVEGRTVRRVSPPERLDVATMMPVNPVTTPGQGIIRVELAGDALRFDERLAIVEDWDLWMRLLDRGDLLLVPQPTLLYRRHDSNSTLDYARERAMRERLFALRFADAPASETRLATLRTAYLFSMYGSNAHFCRLWGLQAVQRRQPALAARFFLRSCRAHVRGAWARLTWRRVQRHRLGVAA